MAWHSRNRSEEEEEAPQRHEGHKENSIRMEESLGLLCVLRAHLCSQVINSVSTISEMPQRNQPRAIERQTRRVYDNERPSWKLITAKGNRPTTADGKPSNEGTATTRSATGSTSSIAINYPFRGRTIAKPTPSGISKRRTNSIRPAIPLSKANSCSVRPHPMFITTRLPTSLSCA